MEIADSAGTNCTSFVVMPNHVHLLVTPHVVARKWLGPLKGFTAREANRILGRGGSRSGRMKATTILSEVEFERIRQAWLPWLSSFAGRVPVPLRPPERRLQPGLAAPQGTQCRGWKRLFRSNLPQPALREIIELAIQSGEPAWCN
jgi:hypothetical protein